MFRSAALLSLLSQAALGAVVDVWYNVSWVENIDAGGLFTRRAVGVNGTWPPPILNVQANDTVRVHAYNGFADANEGTSIHHHGMFFNGSAYYDGAPAATQCKIPTGQTLVYEVPVNTQHGTYWWHSHVGSQYVDGLRAPFVIHPAQEVHAYDDEYTVILSDWYKEEHAVLMKKFMSIANPTGAEPVPETALMYFAKNGTYLPGFNENATMTFEPGKTYRLRILNVGAFAMFHFWIDGHQMRIIEADGTDVEEYPVDYVGVSVAQRYSVLVTARNDTNSNFLIHANFDETMFDSYGPDQLLNFTSTLSYGTSAPVAEAETREEFVRTPDNLFSPVPAEAQLPPPNHQIELGVFFDTFDDGINRAAFNNITWVAPQVPSLFTAMSMGADAMNSNIYGRQTHALTLEKGDIVDLQVINWDGNPHPFHLHGHKFQIVRLATDVSTNDTTANPPHTEGAPNPMRRDTINIPGEGGAVNLRFVADNPGAWLFHCHIEFHFEAGLAVVFIEAPTQAQETMSIPQVMLDQCAMQNIPVAGNAVGKFSTTDLAGAATGPNPQVLGWRPKGIGALAGTIIAALLGMATVVWYAIGGQLDEEDVEEEVDRALEKKKEGGLIKRNVKKAIKAAKP